MGIADLIRDRLAKLPGPRSLVEIGLGPDETAALARWADTVHPLLMEAQPVPFALTFLACATVAAREYSSDAALWPFVRAFFSHNQHAPRIFTTNDVPVLYLRETIERAARHHDLRHAFDRNEGEHRAYTTVLLQCGFTRPGLARLPEWLAGRRPWRSIDLLLDDPFLASSTFKASFERLRDYRLGWTDDLPASPWLGGDLNHLARKAARTSLSLGTCAAGPPPAPGVRLIDGTGGLSFRVPISLPIAVVEKGHPHIDLELGGRRGRRAIRQPDGSYFAPAAEDVALTEASATGTIQLRFLDPDRIALHEEDVELFAGNDDIDIFVATTGGEFRRITDPWADLISSETAFLRVANDLPMKGSFAAGRIRVGRDGWQRVTRTEMSGVQVVFDDDLVWTPLLEERMRWAGTIKIPGDTQPWNPGEKLGWTLELSNPRARIRSARLGRHRLDLAHLGAGTYRVTLPARPSLPDSFALRLRIEDGCHRFTAAWPAPPPSCEHLFARDEVGWSPVRIADLSCLSRPVRWFSGAGDDGDLPWLFEGQRPVLPLSDREICLGRYLAGRGGHLTVECRRFNGDGQSRSLSESLNGHHQLRLVENRHRRTMLPLPKSLAWRDGFTVDLLDGDGVHSDAVAVERHFGRDVLLLPGETAIAAASVSYRGESVAATVSDHLDRALSRTTDLTACIRWLVRARAPIAAEPARAAIVRTLKKQPLTAVIVALSTSSGIANGSMNPWHDEFVRGFWRDCVEEILDAVDTSLSGREPSVANLLLEPERNAFASPPVMIEGNAVAHTIIHLAESDPVLAARVLRAVGRSQDPVLARVRRGAFAELRAAASPLPLDDFAKLIGVDDRFVSLHQRAAVAWAVGDAPLNAMRDNVRRLLYLPEFRRSVAADVIRRLTTEESDARRHPGHR